MDDTKFAQATNLRTGINLVRAARRHLAVGHLEETRELIRCADDVLSRVQSPGCEILTVPATFSTSTHQ